MQKIIRALRVIARDIFVNAIAGSVIFPNRLRALIYRSYGIRARKANICPKVFFGSNRVEIGQGSFVNYECFFDTAIKIGKNCAVGYRTLFVAMTHSIAGADRRAGEAMVKAIVVEDGCWIGSNCTILPGITIHSGCVIAAGAVVTRDCAPNGLYAGVPARRIEDLPP